MRARCTSTHTLGASSAGRSQTTSAPNSSSTRCRWRSGGDNPPTVRTIAHSDQYTSWAFGRRLRAAGLLGSMSSIGDCFDNSVAESFFGSLQLELLDRSHVGNRASSSRRRRSTGSNAGTTRGADTATAECSAPSTTRPQPRHDRTTNPSAETGEAQADLLNETTHFSLDAGTASTGFTSATTPCVGDT